MWKYVARCKNVFLILCRNNTLPLLTFRDVSGRPYFVTHWNETGATVRLASSPSVFTTPPRRLCFSLLCFVSRPRSLPEKNLRRFTRCHCCFSGWKMTISGPIWADCVEAGVCRFLHAKMLSPFSFLKGWRPFSQKSASKMDDCATLASVRQTVRVFYY